MVNCFIDSDVILDVLLNREPFSQDSEAILKMAEQKKIRLFTTPVVYSNIHYIISKELGNKKALDILQDLMTIVDILKVGKEEVVFAFKSGFDDFEDGLQYAAVYNSKSVATIITRNVRDYRQSQIPIIEPAEFLKVI